MRPDPSKLVYRIKSSLKGESNGLEIAALAWRYAEEVAHANAELKSALGQEKDLDAYLAAFGGPCPLDTLDALDFAEADSWRERCSLLGWRIVDPIDHADSQALRQRFAAIENPKEWLLGEFRTRVRSKQALEAFPIIKLLSERYEADSDIASERQRLEAQLVEQADTEIGYAIEDLKPLESPSAIAQRYLDHGIEPPETEGPFKSVLKSMDADELQQIGHAISSLSQTLEKAEASEPTSELETAYFECDARISRSRQRANLSQDQKDALSKVETALARARRSSESTILIQSAVNELKIAQEGSAKKAVVRHSRERLISLEGQAGKMGHPIPVALQEEIRQVLASGKRSRAPLYASIAAIVLVLGSIGGWQLKQQADQNRYAATLQTAAAAISQAATRQNIPQAEEALAEWQSVIDSAPQGHALAATARQLKDWIDEQVQLEQRYSEIADKLDGIRKLSGANPHSTIIPPLLDEAATLRKQLTSQTEYEADARVELFKRWQVDRIAQLQTDRKSQLAGVLGAAQDQLEQAAAAADRAAFERHSKQVIDELGKAQSLIAKYPDLNPNGIQQRSLQRIADALTGLQEKRDRIANARTSIDEANDLDSYLESLNSLFALEATPAKGKRDITRILKLNTEYRSLAPELVAWSNAEAWAAFTQSSDYAKDVPSLTSNEKEFLDELIGDPLFGTVYESKVKYFEGSVVAKSEYSVFLADPAQKGDTTGLKTGVNFSFQARGFDENGETEPEAREMNFLSHPDGSFWGFFYEPSQLSQESLYFQETLRVALMHLRSGSPRFGLLELMDRLKRERSLSLAYRAYWLQQLIRLAAMDPHKWGAALSPSFDALAKALQAFSPEGISKRLWLSTIEQTAPSMELVALFNQFSQGDLVKEAKAVTELHVLALKGDMELVGYADATGTLRYKDTRQLDDRLWGVNTLTGRLERLDTGIAVAPYSPVLAYRFEGKPASKLLDKARSQTGVDFTSDAYSSRLPLLFK